MFVVEMFRVVGRRMQAMLLVRAVAVAVVLIRHGVLTTAGFAGSLQEGWVVLPASMSMAAVSSQRQCPTVVFTQDFTDPNFNGSAEEGQNISIV